MECFSDVKFAMKPKSLEVWKKCWKDKTGGSFNNNPFKDTQDPFRPQRPKFPEICHPKAKKLIQCENLRKVSIILDEDTDFT